MIKKFYQEIFCNNIYINFIYDIYIFIYLNVIIILKKKKKKKKESMIVYC